MANPLGPISDRNGVPRGNEWDRDAFDDHADARARQWLGPRPKSGSPRFGLDVCGGTGYYALEFLKQGMVDTMVVCDISDQQASIDRKQQKFLGYYDFFLENHGHLPDDIAARHRFLLASRGVTGQAPSLKFLPENIVNLTPGIFENGVLSFVRCRNGLDFIAPAEIRGFLGFCATATESEAPVVISFASKGSDKFDRCDTRYSIRDDRDPADFYARHEEGYPAYGFYQRDDICAYMQDLGFTFHDEAITTKDIYDPKYGEKTVRIGESCILARAPKKQPGIHADGMQCV